MRTLLTHGEAGHLWSLYRNAQLKYNLFSNEYDICMEFGFNDRVGVGMTEMKRMMKI